MSSWPVNTRLDSQLLNQPDLLLGSVAPTAVGAADDFNAIDGLGHRCAPRLEPRPSWLRHVSGRNGGRSNVRQDDDLLAAAIDQMRNHRREKSLGMIVVHCLDGIIQHDETKG